MHRFVLGETARERLAKILVEVLIAVIVVGVMVVVFALTNRLPRPGSTTPTRPTVYYKNCAEAHADGRWNIPEGDPAYRRALDKDGNGVACESRKPH